MYGSTVAFKRRIADAAEHKRELPTSPLGAVAASLKLKEQVLAATKKIIPDVAKHTRVDLNEVLRDRALALSNTATTLLPAVLIERDKRWEYAAKLRWSSLLELVELEEKTPGLPWCRRMIQAADKSAPGGFIDPKTFSILLTRVYGIEVASQWETAVLAEPVVEADAPARPTGLGARLAAAGSAQPPGRQTGGQAVGKAPTALSADAMTKIFGPKDADGAASAVDTPKAAGSHPSTPSSSSAPLVREELQPSVARLWAQLWIGYSTPVTGVSPLATVAAGTKIPGLAIYKGPALDIRVFAAACAMLPGLRKNLDIRVALTDGCKAMAQYSITAPGVAEPKGKRGDDGLLIARADLECVAALPLWRRTDVLALQAALDKGLMEGLISHLGNFYPVKPDSQVLVSGVRDFVFTSPSLQPWLQAASIEGGESVLEAAKSAATHRKAAAAAKAGIAIGGGSEGEVVQPAFVAGSPLSGLEQRAAPALAGLVRGNKVNQYQWNLAVAFNRKCLLQRHYWRLRQFVRSKKHARVTVLKAMDSAHYRALHAMRTPFMHWRRWAVWTNSAIRMQSFWRMCMGRARVERMLTGAYICTQISRLYRWRRRLDVDHQLRMKRMRAAILLQKIFRAYKARKITAVTVILKRQEDYYSIRRMQAEAAIDRRKRAIIVIQQRFRDYKACTGARRKMMKLKQQLEERRALEWTQAQILAFVERQWHLRVELDNRFPPPGVGQLSEQKRQQRADKKRALQMAEQEAQKAVKDIQAKVTGRAADANNNGIDNAGVGLSSAVEGVLVGGPDGAPVFKVVVAPQQQQAGDSRAVGVIRPKKATAPSLKSPMSSPILPIAGGGAAPIRRLRSTKIMAVTLLKTFFKRVQARIASRDKAMKRYERRYDLDANGYFYVDGVTGQRLPRRPAALGDRSEIAVSDLWAARWDAALAGFGDGMYYFNMASHQVTWEQPPGTVMCASCERAFVERYCAGPASTWCGRAVCQPCFDKQHAYIGKLHHSAHEFEWAKHPHMALQGGTSSAGQALAMITAMHRKR